MGVDVVATGEGCEDVVGVELVEVEVVEVVVGVSEGLTAEAVGGRFEVKGAFPPMMVEHPPTPLTKTHVSSKTVSICSS